MIAAHVSVHELAALDGVPHLLAADGVQYAVLLAARDWTGRLEALGCAMRALPHHRVVWASVWGKESHRAESALDAALNLGHSESETCVMTTSHEDESIEETLEFFVLGSYPDEAVVHGPVRHLVLVIDATELSERVCEVARERGWLT